VSLRREIAQCTGTLIGSLRQHVLTAGHCLVDNSAGGSTYDKITYYPAINGGALPFGTLNAKMVCIWFPPLSACLPAELLVSCRKSIQSLPKLASPGLCCCLPSPAQLHENYTLTSRSCVCHGR